MFVYHAIIKRFICTQRLDYVNTGNFISQIIPLFVAFCQ